MAHIEWDDYTVIVKGKPQLRADTKTHLSNKTKELTASASHIPDNGWLGFLVALGIMGSTSRYRIVNPSGYTGMYQVSIGYINQAHFFLLRRP